MTVPGAARHKYLSWDRSLNMLAALSSPITANEQIKISCLSFRTG